MKSLRSRLNRGLVIILIVVFAGQWILGSLAIRKVTEDQMLTRIEHDGDALLASLDFDGSSPKFDATRLGPIYQQPFSGHYYAVHIGDLVYRSLSMRDQQMPAYPLAPGQRFRGHVDGPAGQPLLMLSRGYTLAGNSITIAVGEDLTDLNTAVAKLSLAYLGFTLVVFTVAIILKTLDVYLALRPLSAIRQELLQIARGERNAFLADVPKEIEPLANAINHLLKLVERRLQQSRTAVGNLAHGLKTPLAVLFRIAEDPSLEELPHLRRQMQAQTAAIRDRLERELKRARLAGCVSAEASFNPQNELQVLVKILNSVYQGKELDIELQAPDRMVPLDREDMLELVGNLADNACKWAKHRVLIAVTPLEVGIALAVSDDGPGCTAEEAEQLAKRGLRLDESREGHGLGLAIVKDIVDFYEGSLQFDRSPELGGLRARVTLFCQRDLNQPQTTSN